MRDRTCAIVGVHEHPLRKAAGKTNYGLLAESARAALQEAGLSFRDVDGLCWVVNGEPSITQAYNLADYLNLHPKMVDSTRIGGASLLSYVNHAESWIATGKANVVLIGYGSTAASQAIPIGTGRIPKPGAGDLPGASRVNGLQESFEDIYGITSVGMYAMVAQRHMAQYGTTREQLAEIAMVMRRHAAWNPHAVFRDPITVQDVLSSPMISSPLHRLDCCPITDGAGAIVVASPEVAKSCATRPVWVLGCAEAVEDMRLGKGDVTTIAAAQSGPRALAAAGITHSDIDMLMLYDSFTITVLVTLENLGFCGRGEGGAFVQSGCLGLGGKLPLNTDGGGLSSTQPGMRGIFLLIEATRQLRGDYAGSPRQIPECRIALCHGTGGSLSTRHSGATVILGRD